MTDSTADKPTDAPVTDWDSLLSAAEMVDTVVREKRTSVPVPAPVLLAVQKAQKDGKRIVLPYVADKFDELSAVFYSSGDLLDPKASITIARVKRDANGRDTVLKAGEDGATHVRITVGQRRGQQQKNKSAKGDA